MSQVEPILATRGLSKEFPGVAALRQVSISLLPGEVHGLVGENGAGKSTLMKILAGVQPPSSGEILLAGGPIAFSGVRAAQQHGIAMIHQELNLVEELSVSENISLGREPALFGLVRHRKMAREARAILRKLNSSLNPRELVRNLSIAEKQLVEIAKAVSSNARILIMDEPTAVLTQRETAALFQLIAQLRCEGVAIIYISHLLPEVLQISDRITVMRDGQVVRTLSREEVKLTHERDLASMMVGRPLADHFPARSLPDEHLLFSAENVSSGQKVHSVSIRIRRGEIFGLAGLVGAGRTELGEAIAGLRRCRSGRLTLADKELAIRTPADAVQAGIAYLSEDRKGRGLTLPMSITENIVMVSLQRYGRVLLHGRTQREAASSYISPLHIKLADLDDPVQNLSGGNQQKVALAKWLEIHPKLLILDEPTRGVDIGAKEEIYRLIKALAADGRAILMISSELNELLGMCHRIGVMREGRLVGTVEANDASEETLMHLAAGITARS